MLTPAHARTCCVFVLLLSGGPVVSAAEPYLEFVKGLRERGYNDVALDYLRDLESQDGVPPEVRTVIPYEIGVTLHAQASRMKNRQRQRAVYDDATASLARFVQQAPKGHPLLPEANTMRGQVWLGLAQVESWEANSPTNAGNEAQFQKTAREYIEKARGIFQQARDQYEAQVQTFPTFIPPEEKALREQRKTAEQRFIQAQLNLARCTYQRAQAFPDDSKLKADTLTQAADEFREIRERYRTYFSGLYARLYQGKCFEEQGKIREALGIYNEVLDHPGSRDNAAFNQLQDIARRFRLICLNHPDRSDFQLVVDEGAAWRRDNKPRINTATGLGIAFELARAHESIADQRDTSPNAKDDALNQALTLARQINRFPGELKSVSGAMIQRLLVKLSRDPGDPKDFDTAFGRGNNLLDTLGQKKNVYDAAVTSGDKKVIAETKTQLQAAAGEASRMYRIALQQATPQTDRQQVNFARYRLAYTYLLEGKYLESAVLGSYIATKYRTQDPETAVDAAYLALAGLDREYFAAPKGERDFELGQVLTMAELIVTDFPESDQANDAKLAAARLLRVDGRMLEAGQWYERVPETAAQYPQAQINGGQAYWNLYLTESSRPEAERPSAEQLTEYRQLAEDRLERGINVRQEQLKPETETPDELALAKLSLAQIRNGNGAYKTQDGVAGAIELLTAGPHAVTKAVAVAKGATRPTQKGAVQGRAIAGLAYQQLLRAYIGVRDLDKARDARQQLEAVAGKDDQAALTQVYVEFGRELQNELAALKASGQNRRSDEVRTAFEEFLDDLFQRTDGQTFNSLLWIAETYSGLGDGSADKPKAAKKYFDKAAAAYATILKNAGQPNFPSEPSQVAGVRVRLANSQRRQGDFEASEQTMFAVLKELPKALDAQIEAAQLYEDWGDAQGTDGTETYRTALTGRDEPAVIWGYGRLAQRLQRVYEQDFGNDDIREKYFDARFHVADVYRKLADVQTGDERTDSLKRGQLAIQRFAVMTSRFPNDEYARFNKLNKQLLSDLGRPEVELKAGGSTFNTTDASAVAANSTDQPSPQATPTGDSTQTPASTSAAASGTQVNWLPIAIVILLAAACGGGLFVMQNAQKKKRRARLAKYKTTPSGKTSA